MTLIAGVILCAVSAFAAPAPPTGPAPDALESTLATVDDLLSRFEETAASYHVLLVKEPAARREAALQLVRLARKAEARGDRAMAMRYLGWAAEFPGAWWYQTSLQPPSLEVLLEAMEQVRQECEAKQGCTPLPAESGDPAQWNRLAALVERRPYMPRPECVPTGDGGYDTVLDFTHYPAGTYAIEVSAPGIEGTKQQISQAVPVLHVPQSLGFYSITAQLPAGPVTHQYRAAVVRANAEGITLNGAPWRVRARRLIGIETATPEPTRAALQAAMSEGCNLGIAAAPPVWLLEIAEELKLGLAIEPGIPANDTDCMLCAGGTGVSGLQDRIAAHVRRYAEAPAVMLWLALPPVSDDAGAALHAVYPMYKQLDVYERPVGYLGPTSESTSLDIATATANEAERNELIDHAKKLDVPCLTIGVESDGAAGVVVGELDLASATS